MHALRRLLLALLTPLALLHSASSPEDTLRELVARENTLFADAIKRGETLDPDNFQTAIQQLVNDYEKFLSAHEKFAPAYVTYARLLDRVGMRKQATAHYRLADKLDPTLPFVKNQLGNHLAEDGNPIAALNYFLAAIQFAPDEPLYHFQLGNLLTEAKADFIRSGSWNRDTLNKSTLDAFATAHRLAPDDPRYAYRLGLCYYDLDAPDWEAALLHWRRFETTLEPGLQQQTCRLHQAKVLIHLQRPEEARATLANITDPTLTPPKDKLLQTLDSPAPSPPAAK